MSNKNIFEGDSYRAIFTGLIYKRLISRLRFTNADVMEDFIGKPLEYDISSCDNYAELKKAFMTLRKVIGEENIETIGNNRNKSFRYIGEKDDPLADMRQAKAIKDIQRYYEFCQDSAGFFPASWLEYFLKDSLDLLDIKRRRRKGEQIISVSLDRQLKNISLLPYLYEAIRNREVLTVRYKPYDEPEMALTFHPHFLKEYNGRWYALGHAEGKTPEEGFNLAIDRIIGEPQPIEYREYIPAPEHFYEQHFRDLVGVTHKDINVAKDIHLRAYTNYIFNIIDTKPIHPSQHVSIPWGRHEDGEYGEFILHVEINNEFIGRILMMGDKVGIIGPDDVRDIFKKRVADLAKRYIDKS